MRASLGLYYDKGGGFASARLSGLLALGLALATPPQRSSRDGKHSA